jgi:hypothetical protein
MAEQGWEYGFPSIGAANPFQQFLNYEPKFSYYGMNTADTSPFGSSPAGRRRFQSQFQDIYNEFLGQQGQALMGGQMPQQNFTQFLGDYPFTERYAALPPGMRGTQTRGFAPQASFRYL